MEYTKKTFYIFAGVNGTGKSTLYNIMPEMMKMPRINLDEIVRASGSWRDAKLVMCAGRKALSLQKELIKGDKSFNQETTLCGHSILGAIDDAKKQGFRIEVYYVGLDSAELCKERIAKRVAEGGHGIPDEDVERRYTESLKNMKAIIGECDRVAFYDNTKSFELIAEYKSGGIRVITGNLPLWFTKYFM